MKFDIYSLEADPRVAAQQAAQAEETGAGGWFTGESNFNVLVTLAQAAAATKKIEIGTAIAVAFARSPMEVAYAANDLQIASEGRLVLGLGTQVAAHIERRFSMPWSSPVDRMREYVAALQAIWRAWETGEKLAFEGDFYQHTLMTPFFAGSSHEHGTPPLALAAVGPAMTAVAGEVADLLLAPPLATPRYLREVSLPALERGARRVDRDVRDIGVSGNVMVVSGRTEEERLSTDRAVRKQIGFYASTPAYKRVLDLYGWGELGDELRRLSRVKQFDEMAALIDDDVLHEFAVVVDDPGQIAAAVSDRFEGLLSRVSIYPIYRPQPADVSAIADGLRRAM